MASVNANNIYPKYKEVILNNGASYANTNLVTGNVKAVLVDTATYTYNAANQFFSDISAYTIPAAGTGIAIGGTRTTTGGRFKSTTTTTTFTAVTGATAEAIVIYIDTGSAATSPLVAYFDNGVTGLPVTPNGGDISISWNATGIFDL